MKDLSIDFLGFPCKNPFFLAASPVARTGEMVSRAFEAGWGGVVTKSISLDQDLPDHGLSPRFVGMRSGGSEIQLQKTYTGLGNIDFRIDNSVQQTFDGFAQAKRSHPDHMLIISIKCKFQRGEWIKMACLCEQAGADAIEACLSCPDDSGLPVCVNAESTAQVISWIREATNLPVMVKMSAHCDDIGILAKKAINNGADAVSGINSLKGYGGLNISTDHPIPTIEAHSSIVGVSGGMIKPVAQYCIYEMRRKCGDVPLSAIGGVTCGQDAVEFLLLGASTVQVATQVMFEGYDIVKDLKLTLEHYMQRNGISRVADLVGRQMELVYPLTANLSRKQQLRAKINDEYCVRCGRCVVSCRDGAYQAIHFDSDRLPHVDTAKCVGCGLCRIVCPSPGAIDYVDAQCLTRLCNGLN